MPGTEVFEEKSARRKSHDASRWPPRTAHKTRCDGMVDDGSRMMLDTALREHDVAVEFHTCKHRFMLASCSIQPTQNRSTTLSTLQCTAHTSHKHTIHKVALPCASLPLGLGLFQLLPCGLLLLAVLQGEHTIQTAIDVHEELMAVGSVKKHQAEGTRCVPTHATQYICTDPASTQNKTLNIHTTTHCSYCVVYADSKLLLDPHLHPTPTFIMAFLSPTAPLYVSNS